MLEEVRNGSKKVSTWSSVVFVQLVHVASALDARQADFGRADRGKVGARGRVQERHANRIWDSEALSPRHRPG